MPAFRILGFELRIAWPPEVLVAGCPPAGGAGSAGSARPTLLAALAGREAPGRPLWRCPRCGRTFANANQVHICAPLGDLAGHFATAEPHVRATFDAVLAAVERLGPVEVLPQKTRVALHARMSFAAFAPRRRWLNGHLVLARRVDSARFTGIETYSPGNVVHTFRLTGPEEVDGEFVAWLAEAYEVGRQRRRHR